jgi:non-ribosomal peptide synthetase-like protein
MKKSILCGLDMPNLIKEETLAKIFSDSVTQHKNNTALIFNDTKISYSQLDSWSNLVANSLIEQGLTNGKIIGVWHKRSLELHIAILSIVKAGCTYLPVDYDVPLERVQTVFSEGNVSAYFGDKDIELEIQNLLVAPLPTEKIDLKSIDYSSSTNAYILYTSGSTGKPKGIPITQKQICHLIRSENEIIKITASDIVYQGFSVSFDMWCEETWISYFSGATLVVADAVTSKAVDELSDFLRQQKVTVLHAVPSLLSVIDDDIATLRLVNAGGETCTAKVLKQWAKPNRQFFNSYGPTETTVTSSMICLQPNDEITIGHPLPNYNYAVVDDQLKILPIGAQGELVISGPGVGKGYVNLPELSAKQFVVKPINEVELPGDFLYKTGDLVIIDENGLVNFHGRLDNQVKLRGFRIELGEIESQLASQENVINAAVAIKSDSFNQDELVGYVQLSSASEFKPEELREQLSKVLPIYMIPAVIVKIEEFARLPSGKIDKKKLPLPKEFEEKQQVEFIQINKDDSIKDKVFTILKNTFVGKTINNDTDFFNDLGGHSLLAAVFVSNLRKEASINKVSIKDIYLHRPISKFIEALEVNNNESQKNENEAFNKVNPLKFYACLLGQILSLPFIFLLFTAQLYVPYLGYYYAQVNYENYFTSFLIAIILFCFISPVMFVISIICKKIIIGKYKVGQYPLWGFYYFRYWLVSSVNSLVNVSLLNGTPLYNNYMRFMGLKIGKNVQLSTFDCGAPDLVEIGDFTAISSNVLLNNVVIENGLLKISSIKIGNHCYLGTSSVINGGCVMQNQSELKDLSSLSKNQIITEGAIYHGSPAQLIKQKDISEYSNPDLVSKKTIIGYSIMYTLILIVFSLAVLIPFFPGLFTLYELDQLAGDYQFYYLFYTPVIAIFYVLIFIFQTIFFSRILLKNIEPGSYSVYSSTYVKKWLADQFCALSLFILHPIYATVYISSYLRALGAKVGSKSEISTASNITPQLLSIGNESFIADAVNLGEADVRDGFLILEHTAIGNKTFIGNSALIPQGTILGDNMLIGVLSIPPTTEALEANDAKDWFGSPPIAMPQRQKSESFDPSLTFNPSKKTFAKRAFIEFIRIILPITFILCNSWLFISYIHDVIVDDSWYMFVFYLPIYFLGFVGIPAFLLVIILKWLLIGKYKSKQMPMWSMNVWLSEAITATYEALAVPYLLSYLQGTALLPFCLRFLGIKIGKRACLFTTDFTEFDVISLGDDVAMNVDCGPQTHLFEDRIMKIGTISIGNESSIGAQTIILYDTIIGNNVKLEALSLVMKGENLSDNSCFEGCPIKS